MPPKKNPNPENRGVQGQAMVTHPPENEGTEGATARVDPSTHDFGALVHVQIWKQGLQQEWKV